ncbi:hypothetical protein ACBR40_07475 [Nonomuraea sp. AD125B]|uniref:hypothetical protein n=1 Tax=Nonomuraea TaxID=83681 RepID=UPI0031E44FDB
MRASKVLPWVTTVARCFGGGVRLGAGQEPAYLLGAWIVRFPPGRFSLDGALHLTSDVDDEENEQ